MKNIILICASGMSTSIMVKKMREVAEQKGLDAQVSAMGFAELEEYAPNNKIDCLLLGPQISYMAKEIKEKYSDIPSMVIPPVLYGTLNGAKVVEQAYELMGE